MQLSQTEIEKMLAGLIDDGGEQVKKVEFALLRAAPATQRSKQNIDFLGDVRIELAACLGEVDLKLRQILELSEGSVLELDRLAGEPADLYLNGWRFAQGEVVVINDAFGVRLSQVLDEEDGGGG